MKHSLKYLCFSQYFHLESKIPLLTVTRHLLVLSTSSFLSQKEASRCWFLPPAVAEWSVSGCTCTLWPNTTDISNWNGKSVIGLKQLVFSMLPSSFSALPLPGFLALGKAQESGYFFRLLGFPVKSTVLLQSSGLLITYTFCPL